MLSISLRCERAFHAQGNGRDLISFFGKGGEQQAYLGRLRKRRLALNACAKMALDLVMRIQ